MKRYLRAQSQGRHTIDCLEERGAERGSARRKAKAKAKQKVYRQIRRAFKLLQSQHWENLERLNCYGLFPCEYIPS